MHSLTLLEVSIFIKVSFIDVFTHKPTGPHRMTLQRTIQIVAIGLMVASCEPEITDTVNSVSPIDEYLNLPKTAMRYDSKAFSDFQIELGRVLFYDPSLSANNTISCASCHKQAYAFGDNVALSDGFDGDVTLRNTLPLVDALQSARGGQFIPSAPRHPGGLFWDGRKTDMEEAVMEPIFNHIEMGMDWITLQNKLEALPYYPPLFERAYSRTDITYSGVQRALAGFVSVMTSATSKVDRQLLNAEEKIGATLFATKYQCVNCHLGRMNVQGTFEYNGQVFKSGGIAEFANIGLEETYKDQGLALTTTLTSDEGRFRVPSLSNVALTAPYMHDGSIASLEEVIDHYSGGIASHPNLDAHLKSADGLPATFGITSEEKKALVAFLKAFTDEDVAHDIKLSNPFKDVNE